VIDAMSGSVSRIPACRPIIFPGGYPAVTEGAGLVQSRGGEPEAIRAGDTVQAAAGEWHWHGAGPGTFMTHLAVQEADGDGRTSEWGEHVTDEEYLA
jgi:mannose-6-phosphate isomerase-like protein (cupin superfamily)